MGKIIHHTIGLFIVFSRQLLRQHKAKLHKRAKEIQEQLVRLNFILRLAENRSFVFVGIRYEDSRIDRSC